MIDAIGVYVRYDIKDENDETRRERYVHFEEETPELIIPEVGRYIWNWYFELSESVRRIYDGVCAPIPPSEMFAWREMCGDIVYPFEIEILRAMDREYCAKMNIELQDFQARRLEQQKAEAEARAKGGH